MKKIVYFSLLVGLFLFTTTSKLQAEKYVGDFCWQVFDDVGAPDWIYKLGVYQKEGGHFALYGTSTDHAIEAAHGNLELIGDQIKMVIVGAGVGASDDVGYIWTDNFFATLDKLTLSGTWHVLGIDRDTGAAVSIDHINGTMAPITCP